MADPSEEVPTYVDDEEGPIDIGGAIEGETGGIGTASNFKDFLLKPEILKAIQESGFEHPSRVQEETIPQATMGHDCVVQAKSGMGKTLVFVTTVLHRLKVSDQTLQCIVVEPTKDLVTQVAKDFQRFSTHMPDVVIQKVVGGVDLRTQKTALKENPPHIIVATPGRLSQLVEDSTLDLSKITMFVVDEVDKVLEKADMRMQVQKAFIKTPQNKQVLMLSATLADDMKKVVARYVRDPKEILLEPDKLTLHGLKQFYVALPAEAKNRKLIDLLDNLQFNQVMIFVSTKQRADALNRILNENDFPSACLHGGMGTHDRDRQYLAFKSGMDKRLLVTTDVCARGIDVEKVNIVINYDFPVAQPDEQNPKLTPDEIAADTYLHRVGRAGRFGNRGLAVSFLESDADRRVFDIVQSRFKVQIEELPDEIDPAAHMPRPGVKEQFDE
jgi:ATP-dependent RNA helicase UAP56/SUB2